ncbi:MAG: M14 family zinc carboxypeptidase [Eubacteriales bacterium]|nr:M14 family zinc carboxypeptidase [Eubacteriales bacterium]
MKKAMAVTLIILCFLLGACSRANNDLQEAGQTPQQSAGLPFLGEQAVQPEYVVDPYQPYTYEMMTRDAARLEDMYDDYIDVSSIGNSVEGRDITLIKMGIGEKKLLLVGSHHAREYISSSYLMNMIDKYMYAFATGAMFDGYDIESLLNKVTVYVVPMLNPDGVNLVINGKDSVSDVEAVSNMVMLQETYAEWKANINGVDLNRQYPCYWEIKASSTFVPSSEMYKGEDSATEPEVVAMMRLCQNNDFLLAASFHAKGEIIYWADSGTAGLIDDAQMIAQDLSLSTGYDIMPPSEDPAVYGAGFENWFRLAFEKPGFCIELTPSDGTSLPHDDAEFDSLVWEKANDIGVILMQDALLIE